MRNNNSIRVLPAGVASAIAFGGGGYLLYTRTKYTTWATILMVLGGLSALGAITERRERFEVSGRPRRRSLPLGRFGARAQLGGR